MSTSEYPGFFAVMPALTKAAGIFFILAKLMALGAMTVMWAHHDAAGYLLWAAGAMLATSVGLCIKQMYKKNSKEEYMRVKMRYEELKAIHETMQ